MDEPWESCNEFQRGFVEVISRLKRDDLVVPSEFATLHGVSDEDIKSIIYRCLLCTILRPVFRKEGDDWTSELLTYVGVSPTEIQVAFRRTGTSL